MGNYTTKKWINDNIKINIKESWKYEGTINKKLNDLYHIIIYQIKGIIIIKEINGKKEIEINGKQSQNQEINDTFNFVGEETSNINEKTINFKIKDNSSIKLNNIIITKRKNGTATLKGKNVIIKNKNYDTCVHLDLELFNHMEYNNNSLEISQAHLRSSKIINHKDKQDILINSLCGMKNLTNTCYINSSFQILIHIPEFIKIIRRNSDFEGNIIYEINKIYNQILKEYNQSRPVINPKSFVNYFKSNHLKYSNYSQMDSEMFLEELIWDINVELGNLNEERTNSFLKNPKTDKEINFDNYLKESESETNYKINDLFYVYFVHEKKCQYCGFITYYYDETPGLKLNFENTKYETTIDLYTLIMNNFKKPIKLKSFILCQNCQQGPNIIETTRIAKLPKFLILSLQKVNSDNTQKTPWNVKFCLEFGIREIVDIDLLKNSSSRYKLFAINNHLGNSPKSGHYFSQIYLEKFQAWYCFNDESVTECTKCYSDITPNFSNYILFYKQI